MATSASSYVRLAPEILRLFSGFSASGGASHTLRAVPVWVVSSVRPGTTTKVGLKDTYMNTYVADGLAADRDARDEHEAGVTCVKPARVPRPMRP